MSGPTWFYEAFIAALRMALKVGTDLKVCSDCGAVFDARIARGNPCAVCSQTFNG